MALVKICEHIKENGDTCGSPALTDHVFCYFHQRLRNPRYHPGDFEYRLPALDSPHAILIATAHIAQGVLDGTLEDRRARLLLSALRLAISALDKMNKPPDPYSLPTTPFFFADTPADIPADAPAGATGKKPPLSATQTKLLKKILRRGPSDPRFSKAARLLDHKIVGAN
jgi:hypothetical protein